MVKKLVGRVNSFFSQWCQKTGYPYAENELDSFFTSKTESSSKWNIDLSGRAKIIKLLEESKERIFMTLDQAKSS
jgi:hypothetical protein